MNQLMKCQIKIKTVTGSYHYTGLFRSTMFATMDALKRVGYPCCITVQVIE